MTVTQQDRRIVWYRSPVDREVLASLNQRSDWKGLIQTLGHLGLLALTGAAAFYAAGRFPLAVLLLPVVLKARAKAPLAVLSPPVVLV